MYLFKFSCCSGYNCGVCNIWKAQKFRMCAYLDFNLMWLTDKKHVEENYIALENLGSEFFFKLLFRTGKQQFQGCLIPKIGFTLLSWDTQLTVLVSFNSLWNKFNCNFIKDLAQTCQTPALASPPAGSWSAFFCSFLSLLFVHILRRNTLGSFLFYCMPIIVSTRSF